MTTRLLVPTAAVAAAVAMATALAGPTRGSPALTAHVQTAQVSSAQNPIQQENALAGSSGWGEGSWRDGRLVGYASETSVGPGEALRLHVSSPGSYRVEVYRLGWYAGTGARLVRCLPACLEYRAGQVYGGPVTDPMTGAIRAAWPVTDVVEIPADWVSGYYLARLVPVGDGPRGTVPFVVRARPERQEPILVEVPVNTWQAYNSWGGKSLYDFNSTDLARANHVSFDRPYLWQAPGSQAVSPWELPLVRFLEREGYDVAYATDVDIDRDPSLLLRHRAVVVAGHGEYWTMRMRDAFEAARDAGTNIAFLGANIGYWQVRYEDASRTIVGYKSASDPEPDASRKTMLFRELTPPRPECSLLGVQHYTGAYDWPRTDFAVAAGDDPWLVGSGLTSSSVVTGIVSREHDQIPAGSPDGSSCGLRITVLLRHLGDRDLTRAEALRYTASSGARIFSAGSLELGWALDGYRVNGDGLETPVDSRIQQLTRTMLADLLLPAPPARVVARRLQRSTQVTVIATDPRLQGVIVLRHRGAGTFGPGDPGVVRVCHRRTSSCLDTARLTPGFYRYAGVVFDRWARSGLRLAAPVRVRKLR